MKFYSDHFFSIVRFVTAAATEIGSELSITPPIFVNLDAHADLTKLDKVDFLGVLGFGVVIADKMLDAHCQFAVSTYDDPNMVRHIQIMDIMADLLSPTKQIPLFTAASGAAVENSWLVIQSDVVIEPTAKDQFRTLQVINVRFQSGRSGRA